MDKEKYAAEMELKRVSIKNRELFSWKHFITIGAKIILKKLEEQIKLAGGSKPDFGRGIVRSIKESGQISEKSQILLDCQKQSELKGLLMMKFSGDSLSEGLVTEKFGLLH